MLKTLLLVTCCIYIKKCLEEKITTFNPHIDNGDFVVVTNIDKIKFTEKNLKIKIF